uniref:Chemokine interleukin-8-like domain-containing protein n=1 Tax=Seriola lalandi dorsalis TaxID=1841481 RepID=A0A3B4WRR5_SERLL
MKTLTSTLHVSSYRQDLRVKTHLEAPGISVDYNTAPADCCFNFYTRSLPLKFVTGITESHSSCPMQAFMKDERGCADNGQAVDVKVSVCMLCSLFIVQMQ